MYMRVLVRYWIFLAVGLVLGLSGAALAITAATPSYASQVTFFLSTPGGAGDPADAERKAASYVQLLTNERLSADVIADLGLTEEPAELADRITAQLEGETVLITAQVTGTSPAQAQQVATALSDNFVGLVADLERPPPAPEVTDPDGVTPGASDTAPSFTATVIQPPTLEPEPVSPVLPLNLALGAILGLLAGTGAALALNRVQGSIRSLDELVDVTGVTSLGSVWKDPEAEAKPLAILADPNGARAEEYRAVRTMLLSPGSSQRTRTIAVVSPGRHDGRTMTACNLAVALAQSGRKVALVDGDTGQPQVSEYFRLKASTGPAGLSGVLTDALPLASAIRLITEDGLDVLAAGPPLRNVGELLASSRMERLVEDLGARYDNVIVDTPAMLQSSDAVALSALCDSTIMVVRYDKTQWKHVRSALDRLRAASVPLAGGLLNMTPRPSVPPGGRVEPRWWPSATPATAQPDRPAPAPKTRPSADENLRANGTTEHVSAEEATAKLSVVTPRLPDHEPSPAPRGT